MMLGYVATLQTISFGPHIWILLLLLLLLLLRTLVLFRIWYSHKLFHAKRDAYLRSKRYTKLSMARNVGSVFYLRSRTALSRSRYSITSRHTIPRNAYRALLLLLQFAHSTWATTTNILATRFLDPCSLVPPFSNDYSITKLWYCTVGRTDLLRHPRHFTRREIREQNRLEESIR